MNVISLGLKTGLFLTLGFAIGAAVVPPPPPQENFYGQRPHRGPRIPIFAPITLYGSTAQGAQSAYGSIRYRWELAGFTSQSAQPADGTIAVAQDVDIATRQVNAADGLLGVRATVSIRTAQRQQTRGAMTVSMVVKIESEICDPPTYEGPSWERDPLVG